MPTIDATSILLVCTGDACEDVGARDLIKLARQRVPQTVKCKSTGCLGMCGQGPAIAVQDSSGGSLQVHRDVDEEALDAILLELS
jgi:NADH:ubiquinone oxidoreductase subunit E